MTSVGVGRPGNFEATINSYFLPVQNFDLALDLDGINLVVVDRKSTDTAIDFQYNYLKMLYDPV